MDVHLPLSATIKVVNMEHKKKKITMGFALLVCAMVALVGVGYALAYQGSAIIDNDATNSETITVALGDGEYDANFLEGQYTLNTSNNGTTVTLNGLKKGDTVINNNQLFTDKKFHYSGGFTLSNDDWAQNEVHYSAYEVGHVTATIKQTADATATHVTLGMTGGPASAVNQYGFSLVYVTSLGDTVYQTISNVPVTLTEGTASVTITAYLVYSETVPTENIASISAYTMTAGTIEIRASVTDA